MNPLTNCTSPRKPGTISLVEEEVENFLRFAGEEAPSPNSVFIAIMGATGSGKSSFIKAVSNRDDIEIGHDLSSCTSSIGIFHFEFRGYNVYLVDTPGFDDTNRSDLELLKAITNFFSVAYANRKLFNGVILLHRILDTRMTGSSKRNIEIFKELCGEAAYSNVAVLTTMWATDVRSLEYTKQLQREEQLRDDYLLNILDEGGLMFRIKSESGSSIDKSSAAAVFEELFDSWKEDKITLKIQNEMVNELNTMLNETSAGKVLLSHMDESFETYQSQILEMKENSQNSTTKASEESNVARQHCEEIEECIANIRRDQQGMQLSLIEIHLQERDRLVNEIGRLEQRWRDELKEREREQRHREGILLNLLRVDEDRRKTNSNEQRTREKQHQAELERIRREMEMLRQETDARLNATTKAKNAWVGPLLQGVATGGLGLAGTMITAGLLCVVQ